MMDRANFQEALLSVMERKTHWAWPAFTSGQVAADRLHIHLEQEYATDVRDFPVLVGWAYVQCPVPEVRRDLAENLYEEETGGLSGGHPHPDLFLRYPSGLRMDMDRFDSVELLPEAAAYRTFLDEATQDRGWEVACAITTLWIEGERHDRSVLDPSVPPRPAPPLEEHPLVKHYGLPLDDLALTRAHRAVEGDHREAAWRCVLDHVGEGAREAVVESMESAQEKWLAYRDDVAQACGVVPDHSL
jgi:pyrroloquinoline quinone (PQQ) biosynthesis protein C